MIFEDPSRRRWRIAVASFTAISLFSLGLISLFAAALLTNPQLPGLDTPAQVSASASPSTNISVTDVVSQPRTESQWQTARSAQNDQLVNDANISSGSITALADAGSAVRTAFLLQEDKNSVSAFETYATSIDAVFPDWYFLSHADCTLDARIDARVTASIKKTGSALFARITDGEGGTSYAAQTHAMLQNTDVRTCMAKRLAVNAAEQKANGVLVDIESLSSADQQAYLSFLISLQQQLKQQHLQLIVAIPSGISGRSCPFKKWNASPS